MKTKVNKFTNHRKPSPSLLKRLEEARKDYKKIWEDVEPFVRKRPLHPRSTVGEWLSLNYEP